MRNDMRIITLRTLTDKSVMNFGMFADLTVRILIDCNPRYLIWIYFNRANISFCKGIIKELGLEAHTIDKPGTDVGYFNNNSHLWGIRISNRKYGISNWELRSKRSLQIQNLGYYDADGVIEGGKS